MKILILCLLGVGWADGACKCWEKARVIKCYGDPRFELIDCPMARNLKLYHLPTHPCRINWKDYAGRFDGIWLEASACDKPNCGESLCMGRRELMVFRGCYPARLCQAQDIISSSEPATVSTSTTSTTPSTPSTSPSTCPQTTQLASFTTPMPHFSTKRHDSTKATPTRSRAPKSPPFIPAPSAPPSPTSSAQTSMKAQTMASVPLTTQAWRTIVLMNKRIPTTAPSSSSTGTGGTSSSGLPTTDLGGGVTSPWSSYLTSSTTIPTTRVPWKKRPFGTERTLVPIMTRDPAIFSSPNTEWVPQLWSEVRPTASTRHVPSLRWSQVQTTPGLHQTPPHLQDILFPSRIETTIPSLRAYSIPASPPSSSLRPPTHYQPTTKGHMKSKKNRNKSQATVSSRLVPSLRGSEFQKPPDLDPTRPHQLDVLLPTLIKTLSPSITFSSPTVPPSSSLSPPTDSHPTTKHQKKSKKNRKKSRGRGRGGRGKGTTSSSPPHRSDKPSMDVSSLSFWNNISGFVNTLCMILIVVLLFVLICIVKGQ